jgi:OPA family glycerol-3-phosphate transporter-like MFS transporter
MHPTEHRATSHEHRLLAGQALVVLLLVVGYSGYYVCRSDYSVALPLITDWLGARGTSPDDARIQLGAIASLGTLAYAVGKFLGGGGADFFGGRRNFLTGMAGSILFTLVFALGGAMPIFTAAWIGNRLVQSFGWAGIVKITSRWFSYASYGTVMGIISLSYLFGDAAARKFLSLLIARGMDWRGLFTAAAGTLFLLFLVNLLLLKETPRQMGLAEPETNPANLFGASDDLSPTPAGIGSLLGPFLRSPAFWFVCLLSLGFTLLRETFNTWTPTYFHEAAGLSEADAAAKSALFPLLGGVSVLIAGFASDRLGSGGRAALILGGLLLTTAALLTLAFLAPGALRSWAVPIVALVAFLMIGPYSYLGGAVALDFGGKQGSGTASGIIDGVGYLGGVLAGESMARITVAHGWKGAFCVLAGVAALSSIAAAVFLTDQRRAQGTEPL